MRRRESLGLIPSVIVGASMIPMILDSCSSPEYKSQFFTSDELHTIANLSDTILPGTGEAPSASAVYAHQFLDGFIFHCLSPERKEKLKIGLQEFNIAIENQTSKSFNDLDDVTKEKHLQKSYEDMNYKSELSVVQEFLIEIKQHILFAYFTSKEGATIALAYQQTPGRYEGDIDAANLKTWAL